MLGYGNIGFIGGGNMAKALIKGILDAELFKASSIYVSYPTALANKDRFSFNNELNVTNNNKEVVEKCDLLVICVKPQMTQVLSNEIRNIIDAKRHLVISICAGITLSRLQSLFDVTHDKLKLVRCVLNIACNLRESCTSFSCTNNLTISDLDLVNKLFTSIGLCLGEVKELDLDIVSAICGSSIAYMYLMCDAMADGAVRMGLRKDLATKIAIQTMNGASKMMLNNNTETDQHKHLQQLKDEVCSPGGTTIAGLFELEKNGFKHAIMSAIEAATKRARELNA